MTAPNLRLTAPSARIGFHGVECCIASVLASGFDDSRRTTIEIL